MRSLAFDPVPALLETPHGFLRELIESRLLAIVLGISALVVFGLWLAWQLSTLRDGEVSDDASADHGPRRD